MSARPHTGLAATARTTGPRTPLEVLAWGTAMLEPGLRDAVDALGPETRHVAGYHLGWWDHHGQPTRGVAGKALRPTLVFLTAEAAGGNPANALAGAIAVEIVHNHSLLHDDVMDGDVVRHARPTAWSLFGVGPAIQTGDALLADAYHVLATSSHERAFDAIRTLNAAVLALIGGQTLDMSFETRDDVSLQECLAMAQAKTGALLGCACALGGILAGGSSAQVVNLRAFGERLGVAFQLVDDILGIWGNPAVTGKAISSDLTSRKKSLPVVAALNSDTPEARALARLYRGTGPLPPDDLAPARALVERAGGRAWSEAEADRQRAQALGYLDAAGLSGPAATELRDLADFVTSRDR